MSTCMQAKIGKRNMERGGYVKASRTSSKQVFINENLVVEILSRVGRKTLVRCRSVCKNWERLIFEEIITRLKILPPLVTGFYYGQKKPSPTSNHTYSFGDTDADVKFLEVSNDTRLHEESVDTSLSFLQRKSSIVAVSSHEGFVLCAEKPNDKPEKRLGYSELFKFHYIVCNPLTKQWVQLPQPPNSHHINFVHLFCYKKSESNGWKTEFKVVSFFGNQRDRYLTAKDFNVDVYTSETGEWKSFTVLVHPFPRVTFKTCNVLFNGSVYFKFESRENLYVYDLREENIRCIELPHKSCFGRNLLGVSAGSIYYAEDNRILFKIWVLEDDIRWSLQHQIDYGSLRSQLPGTYEITYERGVKFFGFYFDPLAFHPLNKDVIFVNVAKFGSYERAMTILYHKESGRVQIIGNLNHCKTTTVIPYYLPTWVPSLNTTL